MNPRLFFEKLVARIQRPDESLEQASARIKREVAEGKRFAPKLTKRVNQYTTAKRAHRLKVAARNRTRAARTEQQRKGKYRRAQ